MQHGKKFLLIILLSTLYLISSENRGYSYKFEQVTFLDKLPQFSVRSILQNRQGFMWFATQGGLVKYDGYKTKLYSFQSGNPNSLSSNDIRIIYEDSRGFIWIGLLGGGLNRFDPVSEAFIHFKAQSDSEYRFGSNYIHAICEDEQGDLWIGTYMGGFSRVQIDGDQGTELKVTFTQYRHDPGNPNSVSNNIVRAICPDRFGKIWIGTADGLNRFDPGTETFTRFYANSDDSPGLNSNRISSVIEDNSGAIWIGTMDRGLNRITIRDDSVTDADFTRFRAAHGRSSGLSSDLIRCIFEDSRGNLWVGTTSGGLNKFEKETKTFTAFKYDPFDKHSLSGHTVLSICEDQTGNLWFGMTKVGVNKLNLNSHHFFNLKVQAPQEQNLSTSVFAIYEDRSGSLLTGNEFGCLHKFELGKAMESDRNIRNPKFQELIKISNYSIRAIHMDSSGYLWIGTRGDGLFQIESRKLNAGDYIVSRHDPANPHSISSNFIHSIHEDALGTMWIGTGERGISLLTPENREKGNFAHLSHINSDPFSLSHNFVRIIYGDSRGTIWVGTDSGGLNRYDRKKNRFIRYTYSDSNHEGISSNSVLAILESSDGVLWVGTADAGLNKFDRKTETFTCYAREDGLPDNTIYALLEDNQNNLWISTKKGLAKFSPRTESFVCFSDKDGIQSNEFNSLACFKNPDNGQLYFGGINGITTFFPENIKKNSYVPPIQIISFEVPNREIGSIPVADNSLLTLSYKDIMFSFEFVALDFTDPRKNMFSYRLDGFNRDWIYTDWSNRRATFTNIPPGRYTFRVRGSNNHGVWNDKGISVDIFIEPPFWQTWWFRIAVILIFSFFILTLHKRRMQNLRIRLKTENEINRIYTKTKMTPREIEIIELLKKKKSYKQIEDELFISFHTVKNHIYNIYKKLGITTQAELIYYLKSIEDEVKKQNNESIPDSGNLP